MIQYKRDLFMKKHIIPIICCLSIIIIVFNLNDITNILAKHLSGHTALTIGNSNEYTKNYDFLYVKRSKDYIPYSYNNLLDIIFSVINNGWQEFTFYCPSEYSDCLKDIVSITKDETILTHINNFVHPYNNFSKINTSITESGEISLKVFYLYDSEEIKTINKYVDETIANYYQDDKNDFENLKAIHDYIINNTKYDIERNDTGESKYKSYKAYGPVVDGYATCNGYADLMAIILSKLGYENYKIATTSEEISYKSNGHVWNAVKINDEWLHLDLTWDDPVSKDGKDYLYHKYFLVTTEEMKKSDGGTITVEEHNFNKAIYQEFLPIINQKEN